ncbi:MAG TPA: methionyl-tRNA formyltransferase [Xanthobacteraceae bacterium]|nr:methionyl-tRNA formyltransferase [Xanthobacteraceae bacterium]
MRVVFMGTPDFSVPTLQALAGAHEIVAAYTQPPKPAGRGMNERKSPVQLAAEALKIPVLHPANFKNSEDVEKFHALGADVAIVIAYGLLLPKEILDAAKFGCLNLHASLLPRWRGAAPINRAIMAGDEETGVAVMQMDQGLDTGPVALEREIKITPDMTAGELHDKLAEAGADLVTRALAALETTGLQFTPQEREGVTYAKKIDKSETKIDWSKPAREVHNHIRGLSPFPGAWFEIPGAKPLRVRALRSLLAEGKGKPGEVLDGQLTIACGEGAVKLTEVQRAGAKAMSTEEFLRGFQTKPKALS